MAKKTPSGKPRVGEQKNQSIIYTGLVTFTGSQVVDLQRSIKKRGNVFDSVAPYEIIHTGFEDAGGVATVTRLAIVKNADGTFTINASKDTGVAGVLAVATTACTVRWAVLITQ